MKTILLLLFLLLVVSFKTQRTARIPVCPYGETYIVQDVDVLEDDGNPWAARVIMLEPGSNGCMTWMAGDTLYMPNSFITQ